ncbi:BTAD domain-containing putative transcriptional regulator [Planomonospora alba]|uniref:BTAD domain-containing putative transcriptional regulator n=1 Tax=Planomonospora alba TaxID=161354 RepID=A0ABP6MY89_9ACTN
MRFELLGPVRLVDDGGRSAEVPGPGLRTLLVALLREPGAAVPAERLIGLLHAGPPPPGATRSLHSQVSRLRRLGVPVELTPAGYRVAARADDVDAHRFERLAAEGRRALASGERGTALALLEEALGLWRGPAPEQLAARLEEVRLGVLEDRFEAGGGSVAEMRALLDGHPLRERLCGLLMRALRAEGRQAEALAAFERTRRLLAEELGADPAPELAAAHLEILRGAEPVRRGVRAQLTSFVGRRQDVARLRALLGEHRLVTLTGPGGVGKTRLAAETAAGLGGEVCFAELARLSDGRDLARLLLGELGVREAGLHLTRAPDPEDRLVAALSGHAPVLVLDNCEHLVEPVARLADRLLAACPGVRILATGREPLGITGELLFPVRPLPEDLAVRLLRDRAAAVRPGLAAGDEVLRRICRALDGLPLAIELAAARLRSMEAGEVADRLDERFRLFTGGSRTALPRHRTLRAVVAWSWDLLEEEERVFARRFAVFARGATLEAAERVCGDGARGSGGALRGRDPLDLLTALVDKSLVEVAEGRYRMLETIRAFCAEQPAAPGEEERVRAAHAEYVTALAERADPELRGRDQLVWLRRLAAEDDEARAALRRALDAGHGDRAVRLVAGLWWYWILRGLRAEGSAYAGRALDLVGRTPPRGLEEEYLLCILAAATVSIPDRSLVDQAARLAAALPDRPRHSVLRLAGPVIALLRGGYGLAEEDALRGVAAPDPWVSAMARMVLGVIRMGSGRVADAEEEFTRALDGFTALGDRWGMAQVLLVLSEPQGWRGEHARAVATVERAMELADRIGSPEDRALLLCRRSAERLCAGETGAAAADCAEAAAVARGLAVPEVWATVHLATAEVARRSGRTDEAAELYALALAACEPHWGGVEQVRGRILTGLGRVARERGDLEAALRHHREAVGLAAAGGDRPAAASAAEGLADLALARGDAERAAFLLGCACALRGFAMSGPDTAETARRAEELLGAARYGGARRAGAGAGADAALTAVAEWASAPGRPAVSAAAHRGGHDSASE